MSMFNVRNITVQFTDTVLKLKLNPVWYIIVGLALGKAVIIEVYKLYKV